MKQYRMIHQLVTIGNCQGSASGLVDEAASLEFATPGGKATNTRTHHNEYHQVNRFVRSLSRVHKYNNQCER